MSELKSKSKTKSSELESTISQQQVESSEVEPTQLKQEKKSAGFFSVVQSVLAAMIGIQSQQKHQQDFESGHFGQYLFVGIVMVFIFIMTLITIVNSILENSGQ